MYRFVISILIGLLANQALAMNLDCDSIEHDTVLRKLYFSSTSEYAVISLRQSLALKGGTLFKGDYYVRNAQNSEGYYLNLDTYFGASNESQQHYWLWFGPTSQKMWVFEVFKTFKNTNHSYETLYLNIYDCRKT